MLKKNHVSLAAGLSFLILAMTACGENAAETGNTEETVKKETVETPQYGMEEEKTPDSGENPAEPENLSEIERSVHVPVYLETVARGIYDGETGVQKVSNRYVELSLDDETEKRYPQLAKAFQKHNEECAAAAQELQERLRKDYDELKEAGSTAVEDMYLSDEISGKVLRADSNVISIFHDYSAYWGGAHGMYTYSGVNFDTQTGKELLLTDVVKDTDTFFQQVDERLQEQYADIYEYMIPMDEYLDGLDLKDKNSVAWSVDSEGVTVYFNPYTLGAYAMGAQIVSVYFDEAPELFEARYMETPETYMLPCHRDFPRYIDTNGDGKREPVEIEYEPDVYEGEATGQYQWIVKAGNRSVTISDYCYSENSYVVRANDQYYLYLFETSENDYCLLATIDLKLMNYDQERTINAGEGLVSWDWKEAEDGYINREKVSGFSNPDDFELTNRMDILGTMDGSRHYHTGADGYPVSDEASYRVASQIILQAKQDVDCEQVDSDGTVLKKAVLLKDSCVLLVRTDSETWVDVQTVDAGKVTREDYEGWSAIYAEEKLEPNKNEPIYRIPVDSTDYPKRINGIEEDQVFEGILYAG